MHMPYRESEIALSVARFLLPVACYPLPVRCTLWSVGKMSKTSKHTWIVDVIEDGAASIEVDGRTITPIPQWLLPEGAREGDVLVVTHERKEGKSMLVIETDPGAKKKAIDR